jgi:glycerol-3-phosphate dehydrogenase subunit B
MSENKGESLYDVVVIGAGMAGMSAALFAANKGLSVLQCGSSSGLVFSSGLLDVMGVFPIVDNKKWQNPWEALALLKRKKPQHPYAKLSKKTITKAFNELLRFFKTHGFDYRFQNDANSFLPTAQGTLKPSYYVPRSMWHGITAFAEKKPCLLIDFNGLREFSASQVKENLNTCWPGLRCARLHFPGMEDQSEVHPEHMARALENEYNTKQLASMIKIRLKNEQVIGLPAILGIHQTAKIIKNLESALGVAMFEIPTPTVSVSGLRIKELFCKRLPDQGVIQLDNSRVVKRERLDDGHTKLHILQNDTVKVVKTRAVILASGRFFGGGLKATRNRINEPIFDIPVFQPASREQWHNSSFFDKKGHPVNLAGLEVDDSLRPLDKGKKPVYENLFAAGSIIAHQDWIREKSGSGIAVSTAYAAVKSVAKYLDQ